MKNKITFTLEEDLGLEDVSDVPISIRNASLEVVSHTQLNKEISLNEGYYVASATLPHGEELQRFFEIKDGASAAKLSLKALRPSRLSLSGLRPDVRVDPTEATRENPIRSHEYVKVRAPRFQLANDDVGGAPLPFIEVFSGNALSTDGLRALQSLPQFSNDGSIFLSEMREPPYSMLISFADREPLFVVLPASERESVIIELLDSPAGPIVSVRPSNKRTALQLGYLAADMFDEASRIVDVEEGLQLTADAEGPIDMLRGKVEAPISAAIGAYLLLMRGELEDLVHWVRNLATWFEWLPDGAVLYGELLARHGRHEEAIQWFMALQERGLPIMAAGLRISLRRMTEYARFLETNRFPDIDREKFSTLFARLAAISTSLLDGQSLLTLSGVPEEITGPVEQNGPPLMAR